MTNAFIGRAAEAHCVASAVTTRDDTAPALRTSSTSLSERLAAFAYGLRFEDLPASVVEHLHLHCLDLVGVCLVGARMDFADMLHATVSESAGAPESVLIGRGGARLPAPAAALFMGGLAHGNEFDDTYPAGRWHPSAATLPALLCTADARDESGRAFLTAAAVALEVGCRLTRAAPGLLLRGFHSTATAGVIASALGVGKIMGHDQARLADGVGIAGCFASGTTEFLHDPEAWPKRIQVGYAAQGAILAARAASHGFRGPRSILEGRYGYFRMHAGEGHYELSGVTESLGTDWELLNVYAKRYPCDHIAQGYLDCALAIAADPAFTVERIERVEVVVHPLARSVMFEPADLRYRPENGWSARWSMPFNMAVALTDGAIGIASYTDARARDATTRWLMQRIVPVEDGTLPFPGTYPARLRVRLADGVVIERDQPYVAGTRENPMPVAEFERKFMMNATPVLGAGRARELAERLLSLADAPGMARTAALYA
jgi:2-methylcitrate dehydratase PrpD